VPVRRSLAQPSLLVLALATGSVTAALLVSAAADPAFAQRRPKNAPIPDPLLPDEPEPAGAAAPAPDAELEALKQKALEPTRAPLGDIRHVLDEIGADLPDPTPVSKGGPKLRPKPKKRLPLKLPKPAAKKGEKDAKGDKPKVATPDEMDWVERLKLLEHDDELAAARDEAIQRVELIRKIGMHPGTLGVQALVEVGFAHDSVFRDECSRNIRGMGGQALAELIRLGARSKNFKIRRYANYQLDRMDRAVPAKALAQRDDQVRIEILHAFGQTRFEPAVRAVLSQVDAENPKVREMARWAFRRYFTGPRPRNRKRKLKLVGGKESKKEHVWPNYRDLATVAAKETVFSEKGEQVDPKTLAADIRPGIEAVKELFALYDQRRLERWDTTLAKGQEKLKAGDAKAAAEEFDRILASDPFHRKRAEMAAPYLMLADALLQPAGGPSTRVKGEPRAEAERLLRKARLLDPQGEVGKKAEDRLSRLSLPPGATPPTPVAAASDGGAAASDGGQGQVTATPGGRPTVVYGLGALLATLVLVSGIGLFRRRTGSE
jgi:hypothetical protein